MTEDERLPRAMIHQILTNQMAIMAALSCCAMPPPGSESLRRAIALSAELLPAWAPPAAPLYPDHGGENG